MIAGANGDEVRIWSFPDGKLLHDFTDEIDSRCIAFSGDGKELVALEQREMSIYRFDVGSGKLKSTTPLAEVVREKGHTRYWLSSGGEWLCTTEVYSHVTVWDTTTGKRVLRMQMRNMEPYRAPVTRDGILTLWDQLFLERYDVKTGKKLSTSRHHRQLLSPISNADGTVMAAYSTDDKSIVFWDSDTGERYGGKIPTGERDWMPEQAALSADGRRFVFWIAKGETVFDRQMAVFDVATGELVNAFAPPGTYWVDEPIISPDGRYVFPAGSRSVFTPVDVSTGLPVNDVPDHIFTVESLSFTPNGETLLVGSGDKRQAWAVGTGTPGTLFEQWYHTPYVAAVDDDRALISGLRDGGIRIQSIATGEVQRLFEQVEYLSAFELADDRKSCVGIVSNPRVRQVKRWDIATGNVIASWIMPESRERPQYNRDTYYGMALYGSRLVRIDDVQPAQKRPDGSIDWGRRELLLEDWTTQEVTHRLPFHANTPHFYSDAASDETLAIVAADSWNSAHRTKTVGSTYLWATDLSTGKERIRVTRKRKEYYSAFSNVAISRDARLIATVSQRNRIELWNGFTGELIQQLEAPNAVTVVEFSDDGATLASGHQDGRVCLWDSRPAHGLTASK